MNELQEIKRQIELLHLGFTDIRYKTVYCNRRCEGALWYTVEDGQQIPVKQNALRGYADKLEIVSLQRQRKDTDKLQFTLNCGDLHYVLEAGADSEFSQSLVYSLSVLTPEQLRQPIIVQPEPGEDSAVLFARLRTSDYRRVFVERSKMPDFPTVLAQAIKAVEAVGTPAPAPGDRSSPSTTTPTPAASASDISPAAVRFQQLAAWTGHKPSQMRAIAKSAQLPASSASLTPEQQLVMRNAMFLDWGMKYPCWSHAKHCTNAYGKILEALPPDAIDTQIWQAWKTDVSRRMTEAQAAAV